MKTISWLVNSLVKLGNYFQRIKMPIVYKLFQLCEVTLTLSMDTTLINKSSTIKLSKLSNSQIKLSLIAKNRMSQACISSEVFFTTNFTISTKVLKTSTKPSPTNKNQPQCTTWLEAAPTLALACSKRQQKKYRLHLMQMKLYSKDIFLEDNQLISLEITILRFQTSRD